MKQKVHSNVVSLCANGERAICVSDVRIRFDIGRCKGCGLCVDACPRSNIRMSEEHNRLGHFYAQVIDESKCNGCGLCYRVCPDMVIEIEK
ncbi:MAG: 4Fe-4S binding protein [Planctomycetota bacterium]